jgi:hypothetical protein
MVAPPHNGLNQAIIIAACRVKAVPDFVIVNRAYPEAPRDLAKRELGTGA